MSTVAAPENANTELHMSYEAFLEWVDEGTCADFFGLDDV